MDLVAGLPGGAPAGAVQLAQERRLRGAGLPALDGLRGLDPQRVQPTKAIERWQARPSQAPFLCQMHCAGRCTAGEACNQVHADPTYVAAVRELLSQVPVANCCPSHGDLASLREDFQAMMLNHPLELRPGCIDPIPVPRECLAITKYWDRFLKAERVSKKKQQGRVFRFTTQRVCKAHQADECRYGVDCKNIHLCRQYWVEEVVAKGLLPAEGAHQDDPEDLKSESDSAEGSAESTPTTPPAPLPAPPGTPGRGPSPLPLPLDPAAPSGLPGTDPTAVQAILDALRRSRLSAVPPPAPP
eukprot:EG_transcript_20578